MVRDMGSIDTFELYERYAVERPVKALRYQASIRDTLSRPNIHRIERERLGEALRGLASGFAKHPVCERCGRELSDPVSISRGVGPDCFEQTAVSA